MSFSGHSFTGKGTSQKKDKKKKQEFHKHKIKFTEEEHLDFTRLKDRVVIALQKLGNQKFTVEPGGYTFDNWMTSFNLLLDDFEEKAGTSNLPQDYYESRRGFTSDLLEPVDTSDIDREIEKVGEEINSVEQELTKATRESVSLKEKERETAAELGSLKRDRANSEKELENARKELGDAKKKQTFMKRLFSTGKNQAIDSAKTKVETLEAHRSSIDEKVRGLGDAQDSTGKDLEERVSTLKQKLVELHDSLAIWIQKREEMTQLSEKREKVTSLLAQQIASLKLENFENEEKINTLSQG